MTERRFFSIAAFVPVLLAASLFVRGIARGYPLPAATPLQTVAFAAAQSGPLLLVLYLGYLAAARRWVRGRPTAALHLALWLAPIGVALAAALAAASSVLIWGGWGEADGLLRILVLYSVSLALWGYCLVLPIAALYWLGTWMGVIHRSNAMTA